MNCGMFDCCVISKGRMTDTVMYDGINYKGRSIKSYNNYIGMSFNGVTLDGIKLTISKNESSVDGDIRLPYHRIIDYDDKYRLPRTADILRVGTVTRDLNKYKLFPVNRMTLYITEPQTYWNSHADERSWATRLKKMPLYYIGLITDTNFTTFNVPSLPIVKSVYISDETSNPARSTVNGILSYNIKTLQINGCHISDICIESIYKMHDLTLLDIAGSNAYRLIDISKLKSLNTLFTYSYVIKYNKVLPPNIKFLGLYEAARGLPGPMPKYMYFAYPVATNHLKLFDLSKTKVIYAEDYIDDGFFALYPHITFMLGEPETTYMRG